MLNPPFTLQPRPPSGWWSRWPEQRISVAVAGGADAPSPPHLATLWEIVDRFDDLKGEVERFLADLSPDHAVHLQSGNGYFAARNCGFGPGLVSYMGLSVTDPANPRAASLTCYTGYPDGYASFEVDLDGRRPIGVSAYGS